MANLDDEYQGAIVEALESHRRLSGIDLTVFVGGHLGSKDPYLAAKCFTFDLVSDANSDAELLVLSAIGNASTQQEAEDWLARRPTMPRVGLGMIVPGVPCTRVSDGAGVAAAVRHLVNEHGRRKLAFIGGPSHSSEAQERVEAYRTCLRELNLQPEPRLYVEGDFTRESGEQAVQILWEERDAAGLRCDAIVAANDAMALGAMRELRRRGIDVPERISMIGFDDLTSAKIAIPSLSTVRQPVVEQAKEALSALLSLTTDEQPLRLVLPTQLVVRRSCGCFPALVHQQFTPPTDNGGRSFEVSFMMKRTTILSNLQRVAQGRLGIAGHDWEQKLVASLLDTVARTDPQPLLRNIEQLITRVPRSGTEITLVNSVLSVLRTSALDCAPSSGQLRALLEGAFYACHELLLSSRLQAELEHRAQLAERLLKLVRANSRLLASPDLEALGVAAQQHLPTLGIEAAALSLLCTAENGTLMAHPLFAFVGNRQLTVEQDFPASQLAPSELLAQSTGLRILFGLPFGNGQRGLLMLVTSEFDGPVIEQLRSMFLGVLATALTSGELDLYVQGSAHE